jgi:hypothetical protein
MDATKINHAIHRGIERCWNSRAPLHVLASFLTELRNGGRNQWTEYELFAIQMRILRLLRSMVGGQQGRS